MTVYYIWLPKTFWNDHFERCYDHPGLRVEIEKSGNRIKVKLDKEALLNLKSDADSYADPVGGWDDGVKPIIQSAKLTLKAIKKQVCI